MKESLRKPLLPSGLMLLVLLIFLATVMGLVELNTRAPPWLSIHTQQAANTQVCGSPEFLLLSCIGLLLAMALPRLNPVKAAGITLLSALAPVYLSYASPGRHALLPMEFSLLTILVLYGINMLLCYFEEVRSKHRIMHVFAQYIPPQLAHQLTRQSGNIDLGGEYRHLTVLFSDLRNFTGVSEQLETRQLVRLLNEYFTVMTEILHRHGATIDKYIGDSIMTFWGAPLPQQDHAMCALRAALEMHQEIRRFSDAQVQHGRPALDMGIGINTGMMSVGNMGSRFRLSYTVLGDAVNQASRFETLTRIYRVPIVVGVNTVNEAKGFVFRELDTVQVRGKSQETRIFQPLCLEAQLTSQLREQLQRQQQVLANFYAGEMQAAHAGFSSLAEKYGGDGYYQYMVGRTGEKLQGAGS